MITLSRLRLRSLGLVGLLVATTDASAAPVAVPNTPGPQAQPQQGNTGTANAAMGTFRGNLLLSSPIADPTWKGTCSDLTVIARSTTTGPMSVKATGTITSGSGNNKCSFELKVFLGRWSLDVLMGGRSIMKNGPLSERQIAKDQIDDITAQINFPTEPIGVVNGSIDIASEPALHCNQLKVKLAHPARTFEVQPSQEPGGRCKIYFPNMPHGSITATVTGWPVVLPPQTKTLGPGAPISFEFVFPKKATMRVRLRPADYPATHNPPLACLAYSFVLKQGNTVVATVPHPTGTFTGNDCSMQSPTIIPVGVPTLFELKKNGAVIKTETLPPFTDSQFLEKIYPYP